MTIRLVGDGEKEEEGVKRRGSAKEKNFVLYKIFGSYLYKFPGSPNPHPLHSQKMVKVTIENFSNDELEKRWNALENKDNWEEECEWCKMPGMLHKGPCTRKEGVDHEKVLESWHTYRKRMKLIIRLREYRNAGLFGPKTITTIKGVVNECKIC